MSSDVFQRDKSQDSQHVVILLTWRLWSHPWGGWARVHSWGRAREERCACSPPGPFLSLVTALLRYNSHPVHFPCLKYVPVVLASLQSYAAITTLSFQDTAITLKAPFPLLSLLPHLLPHPLSVASLISPSLSPGSLFWLLNCPQGPLGGVEGSEPSFPCPQGSWGWQVKG